MCMAKLQLHMVQHPGLEPNVKHTKGVVQQPIQCPVNTAQQHRRKFMESIGDYVSSNNGVLCSETSFRFWGEYEMESLCCLNPTGPYSHNNPRAMHFPIYPKSKTKGINTDPLVFGDHFYYHLCKFPKRTLNNGDIVLFGTYYGKEFHMDTFFIVKGQIPLADLRKNNQLFARCNPQQPMQAVCGSTGNCGGPQSGAFAYESLSYYDCKEFYSFVPCKPTKGFFGRPVINNYQYLRALPTTKAVFDDVVNQVRKQGFDLGVRLDMPCPSAAISKIAYPIIINTNNNYETK